MCKYVDMLREADFFEKMCTLLITDLRNCQVWNPPILTRDMFNFLLRKHMFLFYLFYRDYQETSDPVLSANKGDYFAICPIPFDVSRLFIDTIIKTTIDR